MPPTDAGQPVASPPPPGGGGGARLQIQWDDLKSRRVDQRLKEQAALDRNRRQAAMDPLSATTSALAAEDAAAGRPAPTSPGATAGRGGLALHPALALALFGLIGGLLAWGGQELLRRGQPDLKAEAVDHMRSVGELRARQASGEMDPDAVRQGVDALRQSYADNPYFGVLADDALAPADRDAKVAALDHDQRPRRLVAGGLSLGVSGMLIAALLAVAEPLLAGRRPAALVDGAIGAVVGLVGGVACSLFMQAMFDAVGGQGASDPAAHGIDLRQVLAYAAGWGVLGLSVTLGPGLVARNGKKLAIALLGGLLGGAVGGAAFGPIAAATGSSAVSRGVVLVLIGVVGGFLVGLIEHAARTGWLKVTAGLIAGKQFILYRNPTFIGSGPECPIYLFKDPQVGRRHAAVHAVPGGFELENLPLGTDTLVNGKPIAARARLRNGDEVQVGGTRFRFQEKTKA